MENTEAQEIHVIFRLDTGRSMERALTATATQASAECKVDDSEVAIIADAELHSDR